MIKIIPVNTNEHIHRIEAGKWKRRQWMKIFDAYFSVSLEGVDSFTKGGSLKYDIIHTIQTQFFYLLAF